LSPNDQQNPNDIDQILNEVEELRRELSSDAESVVTEAVAKETESPVPTLAQATEVAKALDLSDTDDLMKEFHASLDEGVAGESGDASESEESMESTLAELKDDPTVKTLLDQTFDDQARRQSDREHVEAPMVTTQKEQPEMKNDSDETSPSLTMSLTGSMTLRLKYEFAGQEVTVGFTDEFLKIELADGTEFKIPVGREKKTLRRVA